MNGEYGEWDQNQASVAVAAEPLPAGSDWCDSK